MKKALTRHLERGEPIVLVQPLRQHRQHLAHVLQPAVAVGDDERGEIAKLAPFLVSIAIPPTCEVAIVLFDLMLETQPHILLPHAIACVSVPRSTSIRNRARAPETVHILEHESRHQEQSVSQTLAGSSTKSVVSPNHCLLICLPPILDRMSPAGCMLSRSWQPRSTAINTSSVAIR